MGKRILYISVHGVLEYDDLRLLTELGHTVFSVGAFQDPNRPNELRTGRPEFYSLSDLTAARRGGYYVDNNRRRFTRNFAQSFDVIFVNHDPLLIIDNIEAFKGRPIIYRTLGQSSAAIEEQLVPLASQLSVVRYSKREVWPGCLPTSAIIYFAKHLDYHPKWVGGSSSLTFFNTPQRTNASPRLSLYRELVEGNDVRLYGLRNEAVDIASGLLAPHEQMEAYRTCGAYLYIHSLPASYTLNLIEAMTVGCPILAPSAKLTMLSADYARPINWWPERYEVEEFLADGAGLIYNSVAEGREMLAALTETQRAQMSLKARARALDLFGADKIRDQWKVLIAQLCDHAEGSKPSGGTIHDIKIPSPRSEVLGCPANVGKAPHIKGSVGDETHAKTFFGCSVGSAPDTDVWLAELNETLAIMRPKPSGHSLLRIGGTTDGAYLVPDDLTGVVACFSPGMSNRKSFEDQLTQIFDLNCHICDYSSDEAAFVTALIPGKQTFDKLWLEPSPAPNSISLQSWIDQYYPSNKADLLLQIDIEGAEYRNILETDLDTLSRFRVVVIEMHGLMEMSSPAIMHSVIYPFFQKLGSIFTCIHIHPNNHRSSIELPGKINVPDVLEMTFIRTNRLSTVPTQPVLLPHPLDIVNALRPPILLNEFWSGGTRPVASQIKILEEQSEHETETRRREREDRTLDAVLATVMRLVRNSTVIDCMSALSDMAMSTIRNCAEVATGCRFELSSTASGPSEGAIPARKGARFFHTGFGINQFIRVDLGTICTIHGLVITNRLDACFDRARYLHLSVSTERNNKNDSSNFFLNVTKEFLSNEGSQMFVPIEGIHGRYITISSPLSTALHFSELRAYALPAEPSLLAKSNDH